MKPHILIVNDDGIHADGIKHLWRAVSEIGDVSIIAPAGEKSGVGVSVTIYSPLHIERVEWPNNTSAWKVSGTPADCIRLGMNTVLTRKPDLIVSGINKGSNAGRTALYSGTVGGVIEGALKGIPGIAFSCENFEKPDYAATETHITKIVSHLLASPLSKGTILNVTFPDKKEFKGFKFARQGKGYWKESPDARQHPDGYTYYWLGGAWDHQEEHEESDVACLIDGWITAVPLHVEELTDHNCLRDRKAEFESLYSP